MGVMSGLSERQLNDLAGRFHEASETVDGWREALPDVLEDLARLLGANTAVVAVSEHDKGAPGEFAVGGNLGQDWISLYVQHYGQIDPATRVLQSLPVGNVEQCHHYVKADQVATDPYYQEFLIPAGGRFSSGARLFDDGREWGRLGLQTNAAQGPLEGRSLEALVLLTPHIRRAVNRYRSVQAARLQGLLSGMLEALDQDGFGGVVVEADCRIVSMNATLQRRQGRDQDHMGVSVKQGRLSAVDGSARVALRLLVAEAAQMSANTWEERSLSLPRDEGRPVIARIRPIFDPEQRRQRPLVRVKLIDLDAPRSVAEANLRDVFGLTFAEARLAAAMCGGQDLVETADRIGVAIGTVRGQIKKVFAKTDARGQPELAALLERLAVVER